MNKRPREEVWKANDCFYPWILLEKKGFGSAPLLLAPQCSKLWCTFNTGSVTLWDSWNRSFSRVKVVLKTKISGWQDGSVSEAVRGRWLEFYLQNPQGGSKELNHARCPLTSACAHAVRHGKPEGAAYLDSNQQLSNWTQDPLNNRELMPGTGNLVHYPELVKSWIL